MNAFFSNKYTVEMGDHVFPTMKFGLVAKKLLSDGTLRRQDLVEPDAASPDDLLLAHTPEWVEKMLEGAATQRDLEVMELPYSPQLVEAHRISVTGTYLAAREALSTGLGLHIGGGSHHAMPDHGEGFCMFNDLAIALLKLLKERAIKRAMVVDLDVHQGNGTAAIFKEESAPLTLLHAEQGEGGRRPDEGQRIFTFSMHQENNYPSVKPPSSLDIGLADGTDDSVYLQRLQQALPIILDQHKPDLVLYQAGADLYEKDLLGGLDITEAGIAARDRFVFEACFRRDIPVAVTLGGGYAARLEDTVRIHATTLKTAIECHRKQWISASTK